MRKLIKKKFGKVLAGVLSCCMLLNGCGADESTELSWQFEETITTVSEDVGIEGTEDAEKIPEVTDITISQECMIYVYICGAVVNPGVYQVAEGSRLFEVIEAAGGMLEEADVTSQNLARVIQDGEQIQILTKEEAEIQKAAGTLSQTGSTAKDNGLVNINTATVQELTTLTGIGESRARAIVEYRETNGLFKSIDGIKKVTGIKDGLFEKIKNQITV